MDDYWTDLALADDAAYQYENGHFESSDSSYSEDLPPYEESFKEDHYLWDSRIGGREVMLNKEGHVVFRDEDPDAEDYLTYSSDDSDDSDMSDTRIARTTKKLRRSAQTITNAIILQKSLPDIQDVIEKEHLPVGGFAACFRRKVERLNLFKAVLQHPTVDVLELVMDKGLDPNTTWSGYFHGEYTTLLQLAVEQGNPKAVEVLVKHGAIVNKGYPSTILQQRKPASLLDDSAPSMHRNALSSALKKDNPELMKPLVGQYDGPTPALLLALDLGAAKCGGILIEDEKQHVEIKAGKIPLGTGIQYGVKLIPKLYEIGAGVYTKEDLNTCLYSVFNEKTYRRGRATEIPAGLDKRLATLIELGADVNCKVKTEIYPLLGIFLHAYSVYTPEQEQAILSVLLEHGATAESDAFQTFILAKTSRMYIRHNCREKRAISNRRLLSITKEMFSMIKKVNNVFGSRKGNDRPRKLWDVMGSGKELFSHDLCKKYPENPHCKKMLQLLFEVMVTFDVANRFRFNSPIVLLQKCSCLYNLAETMMLLQTHFLYQEHLAVLDIPHMTTPENRKDTSLRFPQVRTLTQLAHVEVFNNLRFPKRESVESLGLPKLLQDFICLVRE